MKFMDKIYFRQSCINGAPAGEDAVSLDFHPLPGGFACYVSASCAQGFDPDESITLYPEIADTADYVAINNHSRFWCAPFWGETLNALPQRTQELLIRETDGSYTGYLPLCDDTFKTLLRGGQDGVCFYLSTNCEGVTRCEHQLAFICLRGEEPLALCHALAAAAVNLLDNGLKLREDKAYPPVLDMLGWCSWDAMQIRVNRDGLVEKAKEFADKGVPVGFAIIDDCWADAPALRHIPADASFREMIDGMHRAPLRSFEGDPVRFPDGMAGAVKALHEAGVPHVGIWFPTTGYWAGIDPQGEEFSRHVSDLIRTPTPVFSETPIWVVSPDERHATALMDDWCARVASWGADFVKIDNQGYHWHYRNFAPIGKSARAIQHAIDHAANRYFDGALINCMGMPSECMFNRTSTVSRCSDDFMPQSRAWFAKNIQQCAFNGLLQGQFYVNDWDMWWTEDEQALRNSVCRAISGGPVYISDPIGATDPEILRPLCLSDGHILRGTDSATPTADCLFADPTVSGKAFKIRNRAAHGAVIAVFDLDADNRPVRTTISAADVGMSGQEVVYYEHFSGDWGVLPDGESLPVSLTSREDFRLYSVIPYRRGGISVLGRLDLYMGLCAVTGQDDGGFTVCEGGKIGYVQDSDGTPRLRVITTDRDCHRVEV